jgi:DNA-binding transcriptional ArsR family regulator
MFKQSGRGLKMNDDKDKITLDKETFKALAADSRIEILKLLEEHKLTLTDLAQKLDMSPSTVKEHVDRLNSAGLIELIPGDTKWKYYKLSRKGKNVLNPYETKVWFVLAVSLMALVGVVYNIFGKINAFNFFIAGKSAEFTAGGLAGQTPAQDAAVLTQEAVVKAAASTTTTLARALQEKIPEASQTLQSLPKAEIALALFLTLVVGLCVGILLKKKRTL